MNCPECDHEIAMHRTGVSPKYAGCMVRSPRDGLTKPRLCWCALTPDAARAALASGELSPVTVEGGNPGDR